MSGTGIVPALIPSIPTKGSLLPDLTCGLQQPLPSPSPPVRKVSSSLQGGPPVPSQENHPEVWVLSAWCRRPVSPDLAALVTWGTSPTPPNSSPGLTEGPMDTSEGLTQVRERTCPREEPTCPLLPGGARQGPLGWGLATLRPQPEGKATEAMMLVSQRDPQQQG